MARVSRRTRRQTFGETLAPPVVQQPAVYERDSFYGLANLVYGLLGLLEAILVLRLLFLLFGANSANAFVSFIYSISYPFIIPFAGIFGMVSTSDRGSLVTFDPATLLAIIIYAVAAWVIVRLIAAGSNHPADRV